MGWLPWLPYIIFITDLYSTIRRSYELLLVSISRLFYNGGAPYNKKLVSLLIAFFNLQTVSNCIVLYNELPLPRKVLSLD